MSELSMDELETVNGGKFSVVTDKGYVGIEVSIAAMVLPCGRPEDRFAEA
jgi:bacteriocin-like protein